MTDLADPGAPHLPEVSDTSAVEADVVASATTSSRRRRRVAPFVAIVVALVFAGLFVALSKGAPATDKAVRTPLAGKAAPDINGTTLAGDSFSLSAQRGNWVLVNFFASWCVPCVKEHPELALFHNRHVQAGDAELVSVVYADDPAQAKAFFAKEGGDWPVVTDPSGGVSVAYGVPQVPETYLIDPDGIVRAKVVGGVTADGLDGLLAAAKAQRDGTAP